MAGAPALRIWASLLELELGADAAEDSMIQWGQTMSDKKRCERGLGGHGEYDKVLDNDYAEIVMRLTNFLLLLSLRARTLGPVGLL